MDTIVSRVCGLDVHEASVVACVLIDGGKKRGTKKIRTFGAMRSDLIALRRWLLEEGVTQLVMEATGVYWRPVYESCEDAFDIWVVNARHVKNVPGRKSDVIDAEWLAKLLSSGLLRKSFIPELDIRDLRDLTRYRRTLIHEQTAQKNRILKVVESAGIKLAAVASDAFGKSGMAMLRALADGSKTAEQIADLAQAALRKKLPALRLALDCSLRPHHQMMLRDQLARLDGLVEEIKKYELELERRIEPYEQWLRLLCTIPGVQRAAAIEIFGEVGPNLVSFPKAENFAAWAGTAPGLRKTAGKNKSGRRRHGNPYLCSVLVECALAATKKKGTYIQEKYRRLVARRPKLCALFAIANKLAHAVHRLISTRVTYRELGPTYLDQQNSKRTARNLIKRLANLGISRDDVLAMFPEIEPAAVSEEDRGLTGAFS
jgi:transposase